MWQRALSVGGGGGGNPIEVTAICTAVGGFIIDTQSVTSVKYRLVSRRQSDALRINGSNTVWNGTDLYGFGTNVKNISTLMSNFEDLLSMPEVSGYRYIVLASDRSASATQVDLQMS